ncbi:MAG TPA: NUDIX domain-containing protein [Candidatus Saccharimonadales bacterium]|nr:NUDIX domain-containing protein [Candidatus Saccharimonadales bacterium]
MSSAVLHKAQMAILYALRHTNAARFSELMRPTGLQSDAFKFHVRKLVTLGYVEKMPSGAYTLTASGKEFANNLDKHKRAIQQQPKLSAYLVITRAGDGGVPQYLFQKRLRNPFYGFWGCMSGPVRWGEEPEETAARELHKQTGLTATFSVAAFCRTKDYEIQTGTLLEDKLFVILMAHDVRGDPANTWAGGRSTWMTLDELHAEPHHFAMTDKVIAMVREGKTYASETVRYDAAAY